MAQERLTNRKAQSAFTTPEDDWTRIENQAEKKRVQNRVAQRNYRQNVKRRIEESEREKLKRKQLEQQIVAQAELIRAQATLLACSKQHALTQPNHYCNGSGQFSLPEVNAPHQYSACGRNINDGTIDSHQVSNAIYQYLDPTVAAGFSATGTLSPAIPSTASMLGMAHMGFSGHSRLTEDPLSGILTQTLEKVPECSTNMNDRQGMADSLSPLMNQTENNAEGQHCNREATPRGHDNLSQFEPWAISSGSPEVSTMNERFGQLQDRGQEQDAVSTLQQPTPRPWIEGQAAHISSFVASNSAKIIAAPRCPAAMPIDERIEILLNTAKTLDLENLENALYLLYTTQFEEGSAGYNAQRLGRLRRLSSLLDSLLRTSLSWSKRERAGVQEAVLRAGENILLEECCAAHLKADNLRTQIDGLLLTTSGDRCTGILDQLQEQFPQSAAMTTTFLLHVAGQTSSTYQSRLILAVLIIIAEAGNASTEHIGQVIAHVLKL